MSIKSCQNQESFHCVYVSSHRISSADGVGDVAAKHSEPGALNRFLSGQLETEQQVLLFSRRVNHQSESVHTLWNETNTHTRTVTTGK